MQGAVSALSSTACCMCTWDTSCPSAVGAGGAGARFQHCHPRTRVCGCCHRHHHPTWSLFCGSSLDIYGRKCHHTNVYCFCWPSCIFLLIVSPLSLIFGLLSPGEASLFPLGTVPGLSGLQVPPVQREVGEDDSKALFRSDALGSTILSFLGCGMEPQPPSPWLPQAAPHWALGPLSPS